MAIKDQGSTSLNLFFLKYLVGFSLAVIFLAVLVILAFMLAVNSGVILPANDTELQIAKVSETLAGDLEFNKELIPDRASYVYLTKDGDVLDSNMSEERVAEVQRALLTKKEELKRPYHVILRKDGNILVLHYTITAQFANPIVHRIIPRPEIVILPLMILGTVIIAWIVAFRFSKGLKREIAPLVEATEYIKNQELDFDIHSSNIREIHDVLQSLDGLKGSLSASLKEQWSLERNKRKQMNALIHDIKTPLTIIKGNSDLLAEKELSQEDRECLMDIQTSTNKIEDYIELVIEATNSKRSDQHHPITFAVKDFLQEIQLQAKLFCKVKNINFLMTTSDVPASFSGNPKMLLRALCNIISNAVDHSVHGSEVILKVEGLTAEGLKFLVIDFGTGFSQEDLQYATTEFYTKQKERSGKHYGLGLYIAKQVAENHGGSILIHNREDAKGAIVAMEIFQR